MTKSEVLTFLSEHKDEFYQKYGITELALFGSYARGEQTFNSDIDIVIEVKKDLVDIHEKKEAFRIFLETNLGKKIDIARKKYLRPLAKKEIVKELCYV